MKPIVVRTTQFTVLPEGDPIFSEAATTVTIKDDAAGEYLVVEQLGRDEQGRIYIEPGQWERVRSAIDVLISECRKDEDCVSTRWICEAGMTTPHPNADILRAIADGKAVQVRSIAVRKDGDDRWWELMQLKYLDNSDYEFRIKPEIININGHEVPAPLRVAPPDGTYYYELEIVVSSTAWENRRCDQAALKEGRAHLTGEAAKANAQALLSFTEVKE